MQTILTDMSVSQNQSSDTNESEYSVFSFGQNSYGELGHSDLNDRSVPTRISPMFDEDSIEGEEVIDVACGNEQTTFVTSNGSVFVCGYNDSGQCGIGTTDSVRQIVRVRALSNKNIVRVVSGNGCEHVAALTDSGALYMFGFNSRGQLGLGSTPSSVPIPMQVGGSLVGKRVVDVACSYFHTMITTSDGELFACGRNEFGQLGTGDTMDRHEPTLIATRLPVLTLSCGQHHTVIVLTDGQLYAFGRNDHGQLGLGSPSAPVLTPTYVKINPNFDSDETNQVGVRGVSCGYYHTIAVTVDGAVYSFGRNDYGQLGLGHRHHVTTPTCIHALSRVRIVQVACGCYHTLTLSDEGKVYPFGRNNHGQLGLNTLLDCPSPQIIPSLRHLSITKVAAGFYHSVCLTGRIDIFSGPSISKEDEQRRSTLSVDLRRLLNNSVRSDVNFLVNGVRLVAHSCILMARCEPLEKMLDGRTKDGSLDEIEIPECSHEAFAALLEFIYTDQVSALSNPDFDLGIIIELMSLADQYLLPSLCRMCEDSLLKALSIHNACFLLESAHAHSSFKLKRKCLAFILEHFGQVIANESFISLPPPLLQEVLFMASKYGVAIPNQKQSNIN